MKDCQFAVDLAHPWSVLLQCSSECLRVDRRPGGAAAEAIGLDRRVGVLGDPAVTARGAEYPHRSPTCHPLNCRTPLRDHDIGFEYRRPRIQRNLASSPDLAPRNVRPLANVYQGILAPSIEIVAEQEHPHYLLADGSGRIEMRDLDWLSQPCDRRGVGGRLQTSLDYSIHRDRERNDRLMTGRQVQVEVAAVDDDPTHGGREAIRHYQRRNRVAREYSVTRGRQLAFELAHPQAA